MSPETWESFFLGEVGAAAALGGLLFVAVSINIERIIKHGGLPERALEALTLLMAVMIIASAMLIPHQPVLVIGIEILVAGFVAWGLGTYFAVKGTKEVSQEFRREFIRNTVNYQIVTLPYFIAGILVLMGWEAGFYLLAATMMAGFVKSVAEAWVLLVEINR